MISGRAVAVGLVLFAGLFAVALWYAQTYAFYEETVADAVEIAGTRYPVAEWQGIDASTSPLKMRACFEMADVPEAPLAKAPEPLVAPGWFDCFDAEMIDRALAAGEAVAYQAATEEADGVDRLVARFPDGRAFMWRQLNERFADK
ncbi:MAG: DUF6446 family protein [Pseudomonadota bacterium]